MLTYLLTCSLTYLLALGAYSKDPFTSNISTYDAFRSGEWCYSDIVVNRTSFHLRQRLATNSTVIDEFIMKRDTTTVSVPVSVPTSTRAAASSSTAAAAQSAHAPPPPTPSKFTPGVYEGLLTDNDGYCTNCALAVIVSSDHRSAWSWTWDHDGSGVKNVSVVEDCRWWTDTDGEKVTACGGKGEAYYWFWGAPRPFDPSKNSNSIEVFAGRMLDAAGGVVGEWNLTKL